LFSGHFAAFVFVFAVFRFFICSVSLYYYNKEMIFSFLLFVSIFHQYILTRSI